ncbi:hypothetical protein DESUT3_33310 [Desulfuromonas versatilis]|uniref:Uncharacterized protein n=1 Tax=Desulfuromonas versatilis TaxID=2802975 RepID=A0ABM8HVC6_9BACT|nr:hypothetical protein [Desulfuromonas versatilis]BCR06262.1 hypothetical protein DESUT3_33310 [Desulfuromonas versatilis]
MKSLAIEIWKERRPRTGARSFAKSLQKVRYHFWRNVLPTALILILGSLLTLVATRMIWKAKNSQPAVAVSQQQEGLPR